MTQRVVATLALLIFVSAAGALDEPKDKARSDPPDKPKSAVEQFKALQQEVQKTQSEILAKYRKAETEEEKQELLGQYNGVSRSFAGKFLDLAKDHAKEPAAVQALLFILTRADSAPEAATAADLILKDHIDAEQLHAMMPALARSPAAPVEKVLRGIMADAKEADNRAKATFALAQCLKERVGTVRQVKDATPDQLKQMTARLGEEAVRHLREADPARLESEAEKLFEVVAEKHADVKQRTGTLGDFANAELFELRNLAIGKTVPEVEAEDIDGVKFKLSDYRGKVVLLDFWGHW